LPAIKSAKFTAIIAAFKLSFSFAFGAGIYIHFLNFLFILLQFLTNIKNTGTKVISGKGNDTVVTILAVVGTSFGLLLIVAVVYRFNPHDLIHIIINIIIINIGSTSLKWTMMMLVPL